jgi:serine/threonine-protein kinase
LERIQRSFGQYEIVARVGRGGMAEIFLARAKGPGGFQKIVALKCVHPHLSDDPEVRTMLLDEAKVAAGLDHPAIVQIHALGEQDGTFFIAMEYVPGQPLHRLIRKLRHAGRRLVPKLSLRIVIPIAEALAFAHERRDLKGRPLCIVHRDVSPQNILVGYDGSTKLADFGIAKAEGRTLDTTGDAVKGKVAYMAPEQVHAETLDGRADVFALGIVLYELLTGQSPFRANNEEPLATMRRIAEVEPAPPSSLAPELGPDIDAIVAKALAKRRDQRYASARELAGALERYAHSLGPATSGELGALMHDLFAQEIDDLDEVLRGMDDPSRLTRMPSLGSRPDLPAATVLTLPDTAIARPTSKPAGEHVSTPPSTLPLESEPGAPAVRPSSPPDGKAEGDTIASHGKWVNYSHAPIAARRSSFWIPLALAAALLAGGAVFGLSGMGLLTPRPRPAANRPPRATAPTIPRDPSASPITTAATTTTTTTSPSPSPSTSPSPSPSTSPSPSPSPSPTTLTPSDDLRPAPIPRTTRSKRPPSPIVTAPVDSPATPSPGGTGRLTLDADPWAQVYIDGRLVGPTPLFEHRVPAGSVTVRLVNEALGLDKTVRLEVPRDGVVRRRVRLAE